MISDCVFCKIIKERTEEVIFENDFSYAIFDKNPFNQGHLLIISKQHLNNAFSSLKSSLKLQSIALQLGRKLEELSDCTGVNFYQNNSLTSTTHIDHLHIHVVPTFINDKFMITTSNTNTKTNSDHTRMIVTKTLKPKYEVIYQNIDLGMFHLSAQMVNENLEDLALSMNRTSAISIAEIKEWYKRYIKREDIVVLVQNESKKIIGSAHLNKNVRNKDHSAKLSIIIDSSYRGEGLGYKLLSRLFKISKEFGLHRIEAEPKIDNFSAINFLMKNGFRIEGIQHHKLKLSNGEYQDCFLMYKLL